MQNSAPRKLLDVVQFYSPLGGGVRRYLEDKIRFLGESERWEHAVIVPGERNALRTRHASRIHEIASRKLIGSVSYRMLLNRKAIESVMESERPDLIEVGDPYRSAWIALRAADRLGIPVAAYYHSDFPRALGRTIRRFSNSWIERVLSGGIQRYIVNLYNRMDVTVVATRRLQTVLTECGIRRVVRIPLGTDVTRFMPDPEASRVREALGLSPNRRLLVYVGRMAREKNIKSLIGMMRELNPGGAGDYHLLMVGDGEQRRLVEAAARERADITWRRYSESAGELSAYYTAADLFVHAGTFETFGITALEAQACGARVLCVRGGGLEDAVAGEEPAVLAESAHPAELAGAVRAIADLSGGQTPGERRERIVRRFSIQTTFLRLFRLYDHIAAGRPADSFIDGEDAADRDEHHHPALLAR